MSRVVNLTDAMRGVRPFRDRAAAGRELAELLARFAAEHPLVLAMPRGGVPVAFEVARALHADLDVIVARKIGAPGHQELGIGAIAEGGVRVLNHDVVRSTLATPDEIERASERAGREVDERVRRYRGAAQLPSIEGRTVIVVDDGLATGGTARAALRALRARGPRRLVLAVPIGPASTVRELEDEADEIVCCVVPETMLAIGFWYRDFEPVRDEDVIRYLDAARAAASETPPSAVDRADPPEERDITISLASGHELDGHLVVPEDTRGLVVFAHGSGSSRRSPRNIQVVRALNRASFGTLLFDLLTPAEERERAKVFDIPLLAERLVCATRWIDEQPMLSDLPLGYFGASTGAAAALDAAADLGDRISAVVSRGGRPDLALARLPAVRAPVLLIVGGFDDVVLELNRQALAALRCEAELSIVPAATHLFEEPGALEAVSELATTWLTAHLHLPARVAR